MFFRGGIDLNPIARLLRPGLSLVVGISKSEYEAQLRELMEVNRRELTPRPQKNYFRVFNDHSVEGR